MSDNVTKVVIDPVWTSSGYRYDVWLGDELLVARSRVPLCDASRAVGGRGVDGKVEVWRRGGSGPSMIGSVARYSKLTVTEGERGSPRFTKWQPFNRNDFT